MFYKALLTASALLVVSTVKAQKTFTYGNLPNAELSEKFQTFQTGSKSEGVNEQQANLKEKTNPSSEVVSPKGSEPFYKQIDDINYALITESDSSYAVVQNISPFVDSSRDIVLLDTLTFSGIKYPVKKIEEKAFFITDITSVTIPASVEEIGDLAFLGCEAIKTVKISDLKAWCNIDFKGYQSNPLYNGADLVVNDKKVEDLVIPEGIEVIKDYTFYGTKIKSLTMPNSISRIGESAFSGCLELLDIKFSDHLTEIGPYAFCETPKIRKIELPKSLKKLQKKALDTRIENPYDLVIVCHNPQPPVNESAFGKNIPEGAVINVPYGSIDAYLQAPGWDAFCRYQILSTLVDGFYYRQISDKEVSITEIENKDFDGELLVPSTAKVDNKTFTVSTLDKECFADCKFTAVTLPVSVNRYLDYAFKDCQALQRVNISDLSEWCRNNFVTIESNPLYNSNAKFYVNGKFIEDLVIPEDITEIKLNAFADYQSLKSVEMHDSVTSVGMNAFFSCHELSKVRFSNNLAFLRMNAFFDCKKLDKVTLPKTVKAIEINAFSSFDNDYALSEFTILNPEPPQTGLVFTNGTYNNTKLYIPAGSREAYNVFPWNKFKNVFELEEVGIHSTTADDIRVSVADGQLSIHAAQAVSVKVYNITGQLIYSGNESTIKLPQTGSYIVCVNNKNFKVNL